MILTLLHADCSQWTSGVTQRGSQHSLLFFFLTLDFVAESVGTEQHPSAESSHPHTDDPSIDSNLSVVLLSKTALLLFKNDHFDVDLIIFM